jgi:hypothetical protein
MPLTRSTCGRLASSCSSLLHACEQTTCTSLFSAASVRSKLCSASAHSSHFFLLNEKTTAGVSPSFLSILSSDCHCVLLPALSRGALLPVLVLLLLLLLLLVCLPPPLLPPLPLLLLAPPLPPPALLRPPAPCCDAAGFCLYRSNDCVELGKRRETCICRGWSVFTRLRFALTSLT